MPRFQKERNLATGGAVPSWPTIKFEMISYTVGNEALIKFDYFPKSYIKRHLRTGKITRHPKLKIVYQFWFKKDRKQEAEIPDTYQISGAYLQGELVTISLKQNQG